jgi:hypothetical protein
VGLCATPKPGVLLPSSLSPAWPAPLAYFPLTAGSLDSWPGGQYSGTNQGAQFTFDTRFGSVLTCHQVGARRHCGCEASRDARADLALAECCIASATIGLPPPPPAQDSRSHATLLPPAYAASGRWAVNVWAKLTPGALAQGRRWSYLLGQAGEGGWNKGEGPNKVRLGGAGQGAGQLPALSRLASCMHQT